jgi:hypothetical protein
MSEPTDIERERELAKENDWMLREGADEQTPEEEHEEAQQSGEVFEGQGIGGGL